ncbi:hypothetical protein HC723_10745 [Vibrio sp. S11_S32]|uniref:hypothetical protein n=1 Tax=Vibrio sp. S11_S32 TaxID=2720225 RepID=UPI0016806458|nr:hypothetical protein [Vibrio sp. S11_S32]MBD1576906.1 hypothetical protein [Vibrio sp. S11_S32]
MMKYIPAIAIASLASTSMMANASVILQADSDGSLLLNGHPAQLLAQVYDANGEVQKNIQIINDDGSEIKALVTIDGKAGLFEIRAYGYHQGEGDYGAGDIYNASCEKIGAQKGSFHELGYLAQGARNVGESSQYEVYAIGGNVSGYTVDGLNLNYDSEGNITPGQDCSQGVPTTGYALQYDAGLTDSVNTYFNQLAFPLSIQ